MTEKIKPMPLWMSLLLFGIPAIVLILATWYGMPWLITQTGIPVILSWFVAGGLLVFIPLFFAAIFASRLEGHPLSYSALRSRLRLNAMNKKDWQWTFIGFLLAFIGMGLMMGLTNWLSNVTGWFAPLSTEPPFLEFHGLEEGQYWFLLLWLIFFFFNIVGEELMWRGYIMPRQELRHGKFAWVINGICWTIFHLAFGVDLIILMLPILFILPYIVQKRKNTWIGILIHGIFNGPIFVAIALNLIN